MQAQFFPYRLVFKRPAGTSRGTLHVKDTYFLVLRRGRKHGVGECALFRGLSADDRPSYETFLKQTVDHINRGEPLEALRLDKWPSIRFGLETALASLEGSRPDVLYPSRFTEGKDGIPINGLIWMGDKTFMLRQIDEKIRLGFRVIKLKIGALDFAAELEILAYIRRHFPAGELEIRVDANGAFHPAEALEKLKRLSDYHIHSIEQPIRPRQWESLAALTRETPIPIALDEELIGLFAEDEKRDLMETVRPQYLIFKPSLLGGFSATDRWIALAEQYGAGWWITSALESNVGLNAIAQYTYSKQVSIPQGLGTGGLFTNNFPSPLYLDGDRLYFDPSKQLKIPFSGS
ncbi:MAG: o-succinylbenzoate synthase [Chlorobi bacterium]|nr:o-succinylbenzoate synthase [Chlorobiota bacterium]